MINRLDPLCDLEVDGGIDSATAPQAAAAGRTFRRIVFGNRQGAAAGMESLQACLDYVNQ
jgi:hypothetical protein